MGKNGWSLRKTAFWSIVVIALMSLVAQVFRWINAGSLETIANWIGLVAEVVALVIVGIMAWGYVRAHKDRTVWTILYIIVMLVAVVFVILPII